MVHDGSTIIWNHVLYRVLDAWSADCDDGACADVGGIDDDPPRGREVYDEERRLERGVRRSYTLRDANEAHGRRHAGDNAIQYNTIRYATLRCDAMRCHAMPCHGMPFHAMPCHAMPCHAMSCHAMPCHTMRCDAMRCDAIRYDTIRYDTIRYNTIQYSTVQYNTIQYNALNSFHLHTCQ